MSKTWGIEFQKKKKREGESERGKRQPEKTRYTQSNHKREGKGSNKERGIANRIAGRGKSMKGTSYT